MVDKRFLNESGFEVFTGNELLLKGGLESRMALLTGYPGSPVSDIFDSVFMNRDLLVEHGILGQMANNEALAAARLNGTRLINLRAMAVMKSVGMHVAADGLAIGNLVESNHPEGGAIIVVGDDPWNETTQINSDSRFLAQHLHMPVLEPSTFQEIKDWIGHAFELSGASNLYVTIIMTTNQADGGGSVEVKPNHYPTTNFNRKTEISSSQIPIKDFVMIPPHTSQKEATLKFRNEKFIALAREKKLNQILYPNGDKESPLGFIVSGISYLYLEHALSEMNLSGQFPILKMGVTHPLDGKIVREFLQKVQTAVVIEEKRAFLETQIRKTLQELSQESEDTFKNKKIYGKKFPFDLDGIPEVRGLNTSILIDRLGNLFLKLNLPQISASKKNIESELSLLKETSQIRMSIPFRTPTFCPGCPHRDSAMVSLETKKKFSDPEKMKEECGMDPVDIIFHGESGCHSMLQFAPYEGLMQDYSGMGLGGGTGAGIDPFIKNKQVVLIGDSTFFHSGMIAVSDSIKNGQDITYIVLDNKTTAMTGHQPTPGSDFDILGRKTFRQNIENIVRGISGGENVPVVRLNPADKDSYKGKLEKLVLKSGVKIVIADKECGITYQRRIKKEKKEILKAKGFLTREEFINTTAEVCEYCLECTRSTGCPGLTIEETDFGPKIATDLSLCVSDGACAKGKVCPSFEKVIVKRKNAPRKKSTEEIKIEHCPLPQVRSFDENYYMATFGVGGMGAGVVSAVLVRAGLKEGYQVSFLDKKGLAIRNGGVYGHILYSKNRNRLFSPLIPYGKANLVFGIDVLETARGLDPMLNMRVASVRHTSAIVNNHKTPTVLTLTGKEDFDPQILDQEIKKNVKEGEYFSIDFSEISQHILGSKLYANLLLIGAAFQKGLTPISLKNLEDSIRESVSAQDREENILAFHLGREVIVNKEKFMKLMPKKIPSYQETVEEKVKLLSERTWTGKKLAQKYRRMVENSIRWMHLDESSNQKLALRIYELIQYENIELAEKYVTLVWDIYRKDRADLNYAVTKSVIENLFKVMAIKDEIYAAHLLTSKEKLERDKNRYKIDESNGDKIKYVHLTRPEFSLLGFSFAFSIETRNWMLRIMKQCKFLRRWLPGWHHREKEFRNWYVDCVKKFNFFMDDSAYHAYLEILRLPESVRGYRHIRYPKMEEAQRKAEILFSGIHLKKDDEKSSENSAEGLPNLLDEDEES